MLNIATKTDFTSTLSAAEFNSYMLELENVVTLSGQTLSGAVTQQLTNAISIYAGAGNSYIDTGTANTYVLGAIGVMVAPPFYQGGMKCEFKAANTNTGTSTVNVAGLGAISIRTTAGANLTSGLIVAGSIIKLWYNATSGWFELASTTSGSAQVSNTYVGGTTAGTANAQTATTLSPTGYTLAAGNMVITKAGATNTGATTFNASATGATNVYKLSASGPIPLVGGEIISGNIAIFVYDGTQYQLINPAAANTGSTKAWAQFTGGTNSGINIGASYNVTSITRTATGTYAVVLPAGAVPDTSFSIVTGSSSIYGGSTYGENWMTYVINSTTSITFYCSGYTGSGVLFDTTGFSFEIRHL